MLLLAEAIDIKWNDAAFFCTITGIQTGHMDTYMELHLIRNTVYKSMDLSSGARNTVQQIQSYSYMLWR